MHFFLFALLATLVSVFAVKTQWQASVDSAGRIALEPGTNASLHSGPFDPPSSPEVPTDVVGIINSLTWAYNNFNYFEMKLKLVKSVMSVEDAIKVIKDRTLLASNPKLGDELMASHMRAMDEARDTDFGEMGEDNSRVEDQDIAAFEAIERHQGTPFEDKWFELKEFNDLLHVAGAKCEGEGSDLLAKKAKTFANAFKTFVSGVVCPAMQRQVEARIQACDQLVRGAGGCWYRTAAGKSLSFVNSSIDGLDIPVYADEVLDVGDGGTCCKGLGHGAKIQTPDKIQKCWDWVAVALNAYYDMCPKEHPIAEPANNKALCVHDLHTVIKGQFTDDLIDSLYGWFKSLWEKPAQILKKLGPVGKWLSVAYKLRGFYKLALLGKAMVAGALPATAWISLSIMALHKIAARISSEKVKQACICAAAAFDVDDAATLDPNCQTEIENYKAGTAQGQLRNP